MYPVELPGVAAAVTNLAQNISAAALDRPQYVVLAIRHDHVLLFRVPRENEIPSGSLPQSFLAHKQFLHELAFLREYLNSIVGAVANINKPVVRNMHAVHRIPELL